MDDDKLSAQETAQRRDAAIRRALNTPPTPTKELVGKTERAQQMGEIRKAKKAPRSRPKAS
jgi:hypothetical protein